ncbi:CGNR zinc finger domain-containing protein [Actinomadura madurae]|uniref:CGNR zinc finger domain-containing protein n=1 Tax=Actinomadura madurae TaxID=1993 RepID=UPI002026AA09|nr:CGNR zinc finger domain-containing protein [Actinomadura madurae]URN02799.1 CGNR zinc finger domain-containing protein [Actinomadura madurae]
MRELPPSMRLTIDFLNTVDVEEGTDVLGDGPVALADWLVEKELCRSRPTLTAADITAATDLRRGLRALALANTGEPVATDDVHAAQRVLATLPFKMRLPVDTETGPALTTTSGDVLSDALGQIATAYHAAAIRGDWSRVRRCPASDCAWVFWDSSKNASRRWCSMRVCGNRAKTRAFAERNKPTPT